MNVLTCGSEKIFVLLFAIVNAMCCFAVVPDNYGPYKCSGATTIYIGGLVSGQSQDGYVMYPTQTSQQNEFVLLVFAHGATDGQNATYNNYTQLWNIMCSWGYIIVAPMSCQPNYCEYFYKDVLHTIDVVKNNGTNILNVFNYVNYKNGIGVFGHSMGGAATVHAANYANQYNITAAVVLHPSCDADVWKDEASDVSCPMLWFTGSNDTTVPPITVRYSYDQDKFLPKIFAEIKGAVHREPMSGYSNREDVYVAQYFNCHIKSNITSCNYFYSNTDMNICKGGINMTSCIINGNYTR